MSYHKISLLVTERQKKILSNSINNPYKKHGFIYLFPHQFIHDNNELNLTKMQLKSLKNNENVKVKLTTAWLTKNKESIKNLFKSCVKDTIEKYKFHPLSNLEIENYLTNIPQNFQGVYAKNELPIIKGCGIINLNDNDEKGSHWCAWFEFDTFIFYFDSFGFPPPQNFIDSSEKTVRYSNNEIQNYNSIMCGWYCIKFICDINDGKTLYDFLYEFDIKPTQNNENLIKLYANNFLFEFEK